MNRLSLALLFSGLTFSSVSFAADWLQFRGLNASGVTNDADAPMTWGSKENVLWEADIPGSGWSSPIVIDGKVFVTTAITDGPQNSSSDYRWEVLCLDAKTGKLLWTKTALEGKPRLETHRDNTYASETPVSDGKYVVAYFGMMGMFCYDLDGTLIWKKDLGLHPMAQDWGRPVRQRFLTDKSLSRSTARRTHLSSQSISRLGMKSGGRLVMSAQTGDPRSSGKTAIVRNWSPAGLS